MKTNAMMNPTTMNNEFYEQYSQKLYRDYLADRVKKALAVKAENGESVGCAPVGYLNVRRTDGTTTVEVDPTMAPLIREAFAMAAKSRTSLRKILAELTLKGLASRNGKQIGPSGLLAILTNPFYIGMVRHRNELHQGTQEPLITATVFEKVRERLSQRRRWLSPA